MGNLVMTAQRLDTRGWLLGIAGAAISGGAGAISAGFGTLVVDRSDPDGYALKAGHLFEFMAICFLFSGLVSLAKFLQIHPVPDQVQVALDAAAVETHAAVVQAGKAQDAVANVQAAVEANKP